jgi:hypothetical protein
MDKPYVRPALVEYGSLGHLTLGVGGTLPDVTTQNVVVNNACVQQELGGGLKTVRCIVAT